MAKPNRTTNRSSKEAQIKRNVRQKVEDYLSYLQTKGLTIDAAYIFGSQAGGKRHRWSDIDVCVVSPNFGPRNDGISYLWRALRRKDIHAGIEPIGFHPKEFTDGIPVVQEILRRGVRII
jgi:predicted nucleotidyltransferase